VVSAESGDRRREEKEDQHVEGEDYTREEKAREEMASTGECDILFFKTGKSEGLDPRAGAVAQRKGKKIENARY